MALEPRRIFLDVQNRTFVSSPSSTLPTVGPVWIREDVETVEIYALRPTDDPETPLVFVDITGATIKFAVGADEPAALQTAWTTTPTAVTPTVSTLSEGSTLGTVGTDEVQKLTISGARPVQGSVNLRMPAASSAATMKNNLVTATNHGLYDGDIVYFTGTVGGQLGGVATAQDYVVVNSGQSSLQLQELGATSEDSFVGSTSTDFTATLVRNARGTRQIAYNASVEEVQAALDELGTVLNDASQIVVSGVPSEYYVFTFRGRSGGRNYEPITVTGNTMLGAPGVAANVSYNTEEIDALIEAGTLNVTMEVEISQGSARQTWRQPAQLSPDLIQSSSVSPLPTAVATSFDLQSQDGSVFTVTVTNEGELMLAPIP
jgi:hypothetical protein